mmetsp:Transcript_3727/g.8749  ORF Transcript_3727/g.8749 Transcript_3727/m.8749 type:complete len:200 (-) Transcript_3727:562-1161(-)
MEPKIAEPEDGPELARNLPLVLCLLLGIIRGVSHSVVHVANGAAERGQGATKRGLEFPQQCAIQPFWRASPGQDPSDQHKERGRGVTAQSDYDRGLKKLVLFADPPSSPGPQAGESNPNHALVKCAKRAIWGLPLEEFRSEHSSENRQNGQIHAARGKPSTQSLEHCRKLPAGMAGGPSHSLPVRQHPQAHDCSDVSCS